MSKILEKCILLQLTEHLNKNNLWGKYQSAYRKFHSCETAITKIMDDILNIKDQNNDTILLFMDLSVAFDTVDHAILISRLKTKFGITGTVLKIILSYLTDRVFYVVTDKAKSKGRSMKYGVSQGSILGPTLVILYMQDLEMIAREHMFADDTQTYIAFKAEQSDLTVPLLETCLMYIKKWMQVTTSGYTEKVYIKCH